jgi:hypothetical protein
MSTRASLAESTRLSRIHLENKLAAGVLGWVYYLVTGYPPPPPPSIFRIMGLGMVWLVKSRCQRTCRSRSRRQRSYGRSLALLLRVSPSRSRCYCLNDYERNRKRAQGQMSQGACGKPACTSRDWIRLHVEIENGGRRVCPRISRLELGDKRIRGSVPSPCVRHARVLFSAKE